MFSGDASHSRRLFFRPALGSLPSARHCSHVCGFLKSNLPFLPGRNCVRGMVRSHTWHVSGFAAASLDLCSFNCRYPVGCPLGHVGEHSLHFIFIRRPKSVCLNTLKRRFTSLNGSYTEDVTDGFEESCFPSVFIASVPRMSFKLARRGGGLVSGLRHLFAR